MPECSVTVVLPCLNEAESLPAVLAAIPPGYRALVVDNNSTDGTADVARSHGADVVHEARPGYGSAVHAGVVAARTPIVAVLDGDGSLDPGDLPVWLPRSTMPTWYRKAPSGPGTEVALARAAGHRGRVLAAADQAPAGSPRHRADAGLPS